MIDLSIDDLSKKLEMPKTNDGQMEPDQRDFRDFPTYRIMRLHQALTAQAIAILNSQSSLNQAEWRILSTIASGAASAAREVANYSNIDPGMISRTLRDLEHEGLVMTSRSQSDRRVLEISLTRKGHALYEKILPAMQARQERLLTALNPEECESLFRILSKLQNVADQPLSDS